MLNRRAAPIVVALIFMVAAAVAQQPEQGKVAVTAPGAIETGGWPAFRGPNHDGVSRETDWTAKWPTQGLSKVWETKLAPDFNGLSLQDGRLYTMGTPDRKAQTLAYCLDAATGKVLWECPIGPLIDGTGSGATPAVSGTHVVAVSAAGRIVCINGDDGAVAWDVELGLKPAQYCYSSSPLIHRGTVIVLAGPAIRAFDLATGKLQWKTDWRVPAGGGRWSSPVLGVFDGQETVVCLSRSNLVGLNPDDGHERWKFALEDEPKGEDLPNTPVIVGNRIAFLAFRAEAARKTRIVCVEIRNGAPVECWRSKDKIGNRTQSLVAWDSRLYLTSAFNPANNPSAALKDIVGAVHCFDLQTGDVLWVSNAPQMQMPLGAGNKPGNDNDGGTFAMAGGKLLLLNSAGCLTVSDVSAKGCTLLSHADLSADLQSSRAWCGWQFMVPPLLLNGRLYLRNHENIACYDVRK